MNDPAQNPNYAVAAVIDKEAPADRIIKALADALTADTVHRDGSRGPDHRTRVQAATKLLEYRIGRPIERTEIKQEITHKGEEEVMRVLDSPAARAALRRLIEKKEKPARVVDEITNP
jgi:hypothetical protein